MSRSMIVASICLLVAACSAFYVYGRSIWVPIVQMTVGTRTVDDVLAQFGPNARKRMTSRFESVGLNYPPVKVTLLAVKDSSVLEMWAVTEEAPVYVHTYPIQALSGRRGPKLREGDRQVPEGLYQVEGLNPNSSYHLSMKLDYPNAFDLRHAQAEGRNEPGTNIFIHGKAASIGCLAMGDPAIEELFVLAADIGRSNIDVAIAPSDPRLGSLSHGDGPVWIGELYEAITAKFAGYQRKNNARSFPP